MQFVPRPCFVSPAPGYRMLMVDHTTPDEDTIFEEARDAGTKAGADRPPTPEEEQAADRWSADPDVAAHEREMLGRGAHQEGEGKLP